MGTCRSSVRYVAKQAADEQVLSTAIWEEAHKHPSYGYRRVTVMLRRGGWPVNTKRVHRLWRKAGLQLPRRKAIKPPGRPTHARVQRAAYAEPRLTYEFIVRRH